MCQIYSIKIAVRKLVAIVAIWSSGYISAYADPPDAIVPYVSFAETYNSNLLYLPNSATAVQLLGSPGMSDVFRTAMAGVVIDDLIGLQHITADINDSDVRFDRLHVLDYQSPNVIANWNWDLSEQLTGNLGGSYQKTLAPFIYFHLPERDVQEVTVGNFDLDWRFHPSWRAVASLNSLELNFDLPSQQQYGRNEYHTVLGLDYLSSTDSSIGLQVGKLRTYFPHPELVGTESFANNSSQDEFKVKIDWVFSDKTRLQFLGGWVDRKYDVFSSQDYSGWNERLKMDWAPTSQLLVNVTAWHEIGAVDGLTTTYAVNRGISIGPTWAATEKIRFDGVFKVEKHTFVETLFLADTGVPQESYTSHSENLIMTYTPTLNLKITAAASHLSTATTDNTDNFSGYQINGAIRYQF
jgi:exopolysaccharide biosynthesis operon protein EpsL